MQAKVGTIVVVSPEAAELLEMVGDGALDVRLKKFVEERKELLEQVRKRRIIFYNDALFMVQCLAGIIPWEWSVPTMNPMTGVMIITM